MRRCHLKRFALDLSSLAVTAQDKENQECVLPGHMRPRRFHFSMVLQKQFFVLTQVWILIFSPIISSSPEHLVFSNPSHFHVYYLSLVVLKTFKSRYIARWFERLLSCLTDLSWPITLPALPSAAAITFVKSGKTDHKTKHRYISVCRSISII